MKTVLNNVAGETPYVSPTIDVANLSYGNVLLESAPIGDGSMDNSANTIDFV